MRQRLLVIWQWLKLPWQRSLVGMLIMAALMGGALALVVAVPRKESAWIALAIHGYALMFVSLLSAMVYASICRAESHLLPDFRRSLVSALLLQAALLIALPALVAQGLSGSGLVAGGALLLAAAFGLASGAGAKWAVFFWLMPALLSIWPELRSQIFLAMRHSPIAPLLMYAVAALVIRLTWLRLMTIRDGAPTLSPADVSATDMRYGVEALQQQQAGRFGRWLRQLYQHYSSLAFERALKRLEQNRSVDGALQLMLLPNLHWRGLLLEVVGTLLVLTLMLAVLRAQPGDVPVGIVASYVGFLSVLRFQQLHRTMLLLRPSLVDAYFSLAPASAAEYAERVARNLWKTVPATMLFGGVLIGCASMLLQPEVRLAAIVGSVLGVGAASLVGLGYVWMTLDVPRAFNLLGVIILAGAGSICTSLTASAMIASPLAGLMTAALLVSLALGFAWRGYRHVQRYALNFDAPV